LLDVLGTLTASSTFLHGAIPSSIGNLTNLGKKCDASLCNLYEGILISFFTPVEFDVAHARFTGTLPTELARCYSLQHFSVGHNHISGTLPGDLEDLERLERLEIVGTQITGTVPNRICEHGYENVVVSSTNFAGCTCCAYVDGSILL
jgi:hypothetical protein